MQKSAPAAATRTRAWGGLTAALLAAWALAWWVTRSTPAAEHVVSLGLPVLCLVGAAAALQRSRLHTGAERWTWRAGAVANLSLGANGTLSSWDGWAGALAEQGSSTAVSTLLVAVTVTSGLSVFGLVLLSTATAAGLVRDALDSALLTAVACTLAHHALFAGRPDRTGATGATGAALDGQLTPAVASTLVVELFVAAFAVHVAVRARGHRSGASLLCLAVVAVVAGEVVSTALALQGLAPRDDVVVWCWALGFVLPGVAAGRTPATASIPAPTPSASDPRTALAGGVVPCAAALLALATSAQAVLGGQPEGRTAAWLHVAVLALLVARALLLATDSDHLTRGLERRVAARTRAVASAERRFAALVVHSTDVVAVVDADGVITYASPSVERVFGARPDDLVGRALVTLAAQAAPAPSPLIEALHEALEAPGELRRLRVPVPGGAGRALVLDVGVRNLVDDPAVRGVVFNAHDVTDAVRLQEELEEQAFSDALTGLPNRALFRDRLEHALRGRGARGAVEVCYLDLDGFKAVNDTLGHDAGDELLVAVARRLRDVVRQGDTVARLGGDEFAVLLDETRGVEESERLAQRMCDAVRRPFTVRGVEVHVATSVGLASTAVTGGDAEQLLRSADLAMYHAKGQRQGGSATYRPRMHEQLAERVQLETDLRRAVQEDQFRVVYQPLVDMGTGTTTGVEALVRWHHPTRGVIAPAAFIPLAEATGLIHAIGAFVLREACAQVARWRAETAGAEDVHLSVNLSSHQLEDPRLAESVLTVLAETGLPPTCLVLEVTESALVDQHQAALDTLAALRARGVRLAIDDFGTGYSSLSYLHRLPVDVLKIDKSFVDRLSTDGDGSLVDAILSMAATLQLTTVAEGVEHEHQRAALAAQGCATGQGFHFSPPVEAHLLPGLVHAALPSAQQRTVAEVSR